MNMFVPAIKPRFKNGDRLDEKDMNELRDATLQAWWSSQAFSPGPGFFRPACLPSEVATNSIDMQGDKLVITNLFLRSKFGYVFARPDAWEVPIPSQKKLLCLLVPNGTSSEFRTDWDVKVAANESDGVMLCEIGDPPKLLPPVTSVRSSETVLIQFKIFAGCILLF
jgi:hypothetical protein